MRFFVNLIINTIAVYTSAFIVPGVHTDLATALLASIVLGVLNTFLKPVLVLLTLPISIITLGLFTLVINTCMVLLAALLIPSFRIDSFLSALLFSIVLSLVSSFLNLIKK